MVRSNKHCRFSMDMLIIPFQSLVIGKIIFDCLPDESVEVRASDKRTMNADILRNVKDLHRIFRLDIVQADEQYIVVQRRFNKKLHFARLWKITVLEINK